MNQMEEKVATIVFRLLFKSNKVNQLEAHICDPDQNTLQVLSLTNYKEAVINIIPNHPHYYCLILDSSNHNHITELKIPHPPQRFYEKQVDFGNFALMAKVIAVSENQAFSKESAQGCQCIALQNYEKIKQKVLFQLEKEKFIEKNRGESRNKKPFVRKPKNKNNLTDIFRQNKRGQIIRMGQASINSLSKQKQSRNTPVQEQESLPSLPKLKKMNTSLEDLSFQGLSHLERNSTIQEEIKSKSGSHAIQREAKPKQLENHNLQEKIRQTLQNYKGTSKTKQFAITLEKETREQLDLQKQALAYLKQFKETQIKQVRLTMCQSRLKKSGIAKRAAFSVYRTEKINEKKALRS